MAEKLSRRDFLKLASLAPAAYYLPPSMPREENELPNIIILVFDAWSARNISLYGYPRMTTPNLEKWAEKAIVYHNHYAAGHFTVPGTAGILTGSLLWQHKLSNRSRPLPPFFREHNLFSNFPEYKRLAYSHNLLANDILSKFIRSLDKLKHWQDLYLWANPLQSLFNSDSDITSIGWVRTMDITENGAANSIFVSRIISFLVNREIERMSDRFPRGLPTYGQFGHFILEDATDWLAEFAKSEQDPYLIYYHLLPPHDPYSTRVEFHQQFKDDEFSPPQKPKHILSEGVSYSENQNKRRNYDEYILYVDTEIDRLFSLMDAAGSLENTWVILTSDHGEIFERGFEAHKYPSYYDPIAKVPLLIFPPGQKERIDIHTPTSAVDLISTLSAIADQDIPDWTEGQVLPPFNQKYPQEKSIFIVNANPESLEKDNGQGNLMMRKGKFKLIHHYGKEPLKGESLSELYDLENDPEEMANLFNLEKGIGRALLDELFDKMRQMGKKNEVLE